MLHACFYTICLLFRYTSWHFYTFSETNLLTSRHSASSLFSAVFMFQKSYIGNILGIGRNKFLKSYFSRKLPEIRRGVGGGPRGPHTPGRRGPGPGRTPYVWGCLGPPLTMPGTANSTINSFKKGWNSSLDQPEKQFQPLMILWSRMNRFGSTITCFALIKRIYGNRETFETRTVYFVWFFKDDVVLFFKMHVQSSSWIWKWCARINILILVHTKCRSIWLASSAPSASGGTRWL
jgi:hypothetical protein